MADGGIGVAGLALAVPGLIDLMIKYGEFIHQKIQTFKNAKAIWNELDTFGVSLCRGNLKALTETAKSFYLAESCDPALKSSLESLIERMSADVIALRDYLGNINPDSMTDRVAIAIVGERRAKKFERSLKAHQSELLELLQLLSLYQQRVEGEVLLSEKKFVLNRKFGYKALPGFKNVFEAKADYRQSSLEGPYREASLLVEWNAIDAASENGLREIATLLRYRLPGKTELNGHTVSHKGVLHCLGYRMQPQPELIFEKPDDVKSLQTVQSLMHADKGVARYPLNFRFRLARQVAEAVLRLQSAALVHKNIRSNSILIVERKHEEDSKQAASKTDFGDVYLTNWCLLRKAIDATSWTGSDQWTEDIYRHPGRQGIEVQERYNVGHDIYSLGVCLLEIGMWECLVCPPHNSGDRPQVSETFKAAVMTKTGLAAEEALQATLKKPKQVKEALMQLASAHLEAKVGIEYTNLVRACLTGLDEPSGFGHAVKFSKMNTVEQAVAFKELVLGFLSDVFV